MAKGTHFRGPIGQGAGLVEVITDTKTLTNDDNGKVFLLGETANTQGRTITLPLHKSGLSFKFMVSFAFDTANWIIDHPSGEDDTMEGSIIVDGADIDVNAAKAINFINSAENVGDWVTLLSDGAIWYVTGVGGNSGAITETS